MDDILLEIVPLDLGIERYGRQARLFTQFFRARNDCITDRSDSKDKSPLGWKYLDNSYDYSLEDIPPS